MKRVMCVYLPSWPLQRFGHEQPALKHRPVAIVDYGGRGARGEGRGARRAPLARGPHVVLASRLAVGAGVRPGMPLAEAEALAPGLVICEYDAEADLRGLLQLAKEAECYSPIVAVEEGADPQGLLVDVAGCGGCFGGEDRLLERAARDYAEQGWTARLAIADTVGAAWGFSRYGSCPCLMPAGGIETRLAPLPIAALRLPAETLALLAQLGLDRVGDLLGLPRADLAARFGPLLLRRLDQALGRVAEVVVPPKAEPDLQAGQTFDFPIDRLDWICQVIDRLAEDVHRALSRHDLGARQLACRLVHERSPATVVEVGLYRPSNCPRHLGALLRTRLEQVQLAEPVCAIHLEATLAERLPEVQRALFEPGGRDEAGLVGLIDRLSNLLGRQAVTRPRCVADAQPEYAFRFDPVLGAAEPQHEDSPQGLLPRPLSVWPAPVPIEVLAVFPDGPPVRFRWQSAEWRVAHWWGPERIETGWWRGEDVQRDYYVVTTQAGSRFWMFRCRDDGSWFLHGCFD